MGCPWEPHERRPCELLEYTGDHRCTNLPLRGGRDESPGNSQRVGLHHEGQGYTLEMEDTLANEGQQEEKEHSLGRHLRLFSQRQPNVNPCG